MSTWSFDIDPGAWRLVDRLVLAADRDETDGDAVWLQADDGRCSLTVSGGGAHVEVGGGPWDGDDLDGAVALSPRLFTALADEVDEQPMRVDVVDDRTAVCAVDGGSYAVDLVLVDVDEVPEWPVGREVAARATLPAGQLRRIVSSATDAPGDVATSLPPVLWLAIEEGGVAAHVEWAGHGAPTCTARALAGTDGTATRAVIAPGVRAFLALAELGGTSPVTLTLPHETAGVATVDGRGWRMWFDCVDATVGRHVVALVEQLDAAGIPFEVVEQRVVRFGTPRHPLRAELHPGPPEVARITTVLAVDVVASHPVLQEINHVNAGLTGMRLWVDGTRIVAGTDVPCSRIETAIDEVRQLLRQVDGLGAFLGALGSG